MRSFGIEPDHPLVPLWAPLRDEIEMVLNESPVGWSALAVYHRRQTIHPVPWIDDTAVVVTATKHNDEHWHILEETIRQICYAHGQDGLRVELIDGWVSRLASPKSEEVASRQRIPGMGASLYIEGLDWARATLGGYVVLRRVDEASIRCGLTCHHVLRPTNQKDVYHAAVTAADVVLRSST